ncbi:MAG: hypothetical protein RL685_4460 [Pseudomonadota bacterium]|jgi:hypothetical protein
MLRSALVALRFSIPRGLVCRGGALLCALGLVACGPQPQGATPMPEPPSIDGSLIGPSLAPGPISVLSDPQPVRLAGRAGAATPLAQVQALNLDGAQPPVSVAAGADGSFQLTVLASSGDELRFQVRQGGERSAPVDFIYSYDSGDVLTASPRHACVALLPGFELELATARASVRFQNDCAAPIQLAAPRFRAGADFALLTPLPQVVAAGESLAVELELRNPPPPPREDVWFVDVTLGSTLLRYPIGVFADE